MTPRTEQCAFRGGGEACWRSTRCGVFDITCKETDGRRHRKTIGICELPWNTSRTRRAGARPTEGARPYTHRPRRGVITIVRPPLPGASPQ